MSKKIHSTAIIEDGAQIADDVEIGAYAIIGPEVKIGRGTVIHPHVEIKCNTEIGEENQIFHAASIGNIGQDLTYNNPEPRIVIGNRNIIRENVTIHAPSKPGNITRMGDGNYLMNNCHLAHDVVLGNHVIMVPGCAIGGYAQIDDRAYVSGLVAVHPFTRIGSYSIIGGNSKVVRDVLPYMMVNGNPALVYGINGVGLRRAGFDQAERKAVKEAYRILYRSPLPFSKAVEKVSTDLLPELGENSPAYQRIAYLLDFIKISKRGIAGHAVNADAVDFEM